MGKCPATLLHIYPLGPWQFSWDCCASVLYLQNGKVTISSNPCPFYLVKWRAFGGGFSLLVYFYGAQHDGAVHATAVQNNNGDIIPAQGRERLFHSSPPRHLCAKVRLALTSVCQLFFLAAEPTLSWSYRLVKRRWGWGREVLKHWDQAPYTHVIPRNAVYQLQRSCWAVSWFSDQPISFAQGSHWCLSCHSWCLRFLALQRLQPWSGAVV